MSPLINGNNSAQRCHASLSDFKRLVVDLYTGIRLGKLTRHMTSDLKSIREIT